MLTETGYKNEDKSGEEEIVVGVAAEIGTKIEEELEITLDTAEAEKKYSARCFQPTYDMTFKLMFGQQKQTRALIHLLNCLHVSKDPITRLCRQKRFDIIC